MEDIKNHNLRDEELLTRSLKEPELFSLIVARYEEPFLRKARSIIGDREEVQDIVQETFTKIYLYAKKFEHQEGATFNSWAYKILLNTTFTYYQKLKKAGEAVAHLDEEIWSLIPDKSGSLFKRIELEDMISSILLKMPEPLARVLALHFIDDMPHAEIAEIEGVTLSAVKTRIHRAKKEFKRLSSNFALN
ncbi:MAG TPA: RNA polymerase sigma factor [Candidatus Paceibacterota bacterium]